MIVQAGLRQRSTPSARELQEGSWEDPGSNRGGRATSAPRALEPVLVFHCIFQKPLLMQKGRRECGTRTCNKGNLYAAHLPHPTSPGEGQGSRVSSRGRPG